MVGWRGRGVTHKPRCYHAIRPSGYLRHGHVTESLHGSLMLLGPWYMSKPYASIRDATMVHMYIMDPPPPLELHDRPLWSTSSTSANEHIG
jgi:hypothetical protein